MKRWRSEPRHCCAAAAAGLIIIHIPASMRIRSPQCGDITPAMNPCSAKLKWAFLCLACVSLASCAAKTAGEHLADMPHWMGGEPAGVPPRRGTPEYDAWMAARAQEAARPKTDQTKTDQTKTDQAK
jgi:hypothetical protein